MRSPRKHTNGNGDGLSIRIRLQAVSASLRLFQRVGRSASAAVSVRAPRKNAHTRAQYNSGGLPNATAHLDTLAIREEAAAFRFRIRVSACRGSVNGTPRAHRQPTTYVIVHPPCLSRTFFRVGSRQQHLQHAASSQLQKFRVQLTFSESRSGSGQGT